MRCCLLLAALCPLVLLTSVMAFANAPAPPDAPPREEPTRLVAPVVIKRGALRGEDRNVQAKIQIPASLVHGLGAEAAEPVRPPAGSAPARAVPMKAAPGAAPAPEDRSSVPPMGTIIAGIALSLAAVSIVFMMRGNRATKAAAVASLAGCALVTGWSAAVADIPPPPRRPESQIVIELVEDGETVTLLLPR